MKTGSWLVLLAVALTGMVACSGTEDDPTQDAGTGTDAGPVITPDSGTPDAGVVPDAGPVDAGETPDAGPVITDGGEEPDAGEPVDAGVPDAGPDPIDAGTPTDGGTPVDECALAANLARKAALVASQPVLGVRSRTQITATTSFPSVGGNAAVSCPVELKFKDSNGNGTLDGYEDWTKAADVRAGDLVNRLSAAQRAGLLAHATLTDLPTTANTAVSATLTGYLGNGVRFGRTSANSATVGLRATWANNVQAACEAAPFGIPFVLSMEPAHSAGNGRTKAKNFSQWPQEPSLAASNDLAIIEKFGQVASQEYRAIGVRMALSPSADLATEPRWNGSQFTYGEDATQVAARVGAYVKGMQGATLGASSVACVARHFPGAGPATGGLDARLEKGRFVAYPGGALDAHLSAFQKAFDNGVAGIMTGYGIPERGTWTALGGLLDGATIEQVGAAYNRTIVTDTLRTHYHFNGLVLAPWGVLEDKGTSPLGAPWGLESATKAERVAKAIAAGVDQFGGLADPAAIVAAHTAGSITDAQLEAAARHVLTLTFRLGLFENPYVDPAQAPALCNTDPSYRAGLNAQNNGMVLIVNEDKPEGWLNHDGDGTQMADKGNAGNGTLKVLPAPPGEPYVSAGCSYFVMGNFDLDYVRSVSAGYGELTNDATLIDNVPVETPEARIAHSDYVFIRLNAPTSTDPDSGTLNLPLPAIDYAGNDNAGALADLSFARAAIAALPSSKTQIIVAVDAGRPFALDEILAYDPSGVYVEWGVTDKVFLDVAFGIVNGTARLPMGLPLNAAAAAAQKSDLAGDGQHPIFVRGHGIDTTAF